MEILFPKSQGDHTDLLPIAIREFSQTSDYVGDGRQHCGTQILIGLESITLHIKLHVKYRIDSQSILYLIYICGFAEKSCFLKPGRNYHSQKKEAQTSISNPWAHTALTLL